MPRAPRGHSDSCCAAAAAAAVPPGHGLGATRRRADGASDDASDEDAATPPPAPPSPTTPATAPRGPPRRVLKDVADQCGAILGAFGEHYGDELDGVLQGDACANQENDRTFVVAWRAGGHCPRGGRRRGATRLQGKAAPRKVVWEVLWLCAPSDGRNLGHGSRAWAALAALAAARRVEGVLVPSTDAALLFWLGCASDKCPLSSVVLREDCTGWLGRPLFSVPEAGHGRPRPTSVRRSRGPGPAGQGPGGALRGDRGASAVVNWRAPPAAAVEALARGRGRGLRGPAVPVGSQRGDARVVLSGGAAPPVKVVTAVVVRDARPRAASFIREDDEGVGGPAPRRRAACGASKRRAARVPSVSLPRDLFATGRYRSSIPSTGGAGAARPPGGGTAAAARRPSSGKSRRGTGSAFGLPENVPCMPVAFAPPCGMDRAPALFLGGRSRALGDCIRTGLGRDRGGQRLVAARGVVQVPHGLRVARRRDAQSSPLALRRRQNFCDFQGVTRRVAQAAVY